MTVFSFLDKTILAPVVFMSIPHLLSCPKDNRFTLASGIYKMLLIVIVNGEPSFLEHKNLIFSTSLARS